MGKTPAPAPPDLAVVVDLAGGLGVVGAAGVAGVGGVAAAGSGVTLTSKLRCAVALAGGMPLSVTTATMS